MQVKYAGVNPVDTYKRSGAYANLPTLPFTPGNDGSGLVAKVGNEVTRVKVYYSFVFNCMIILFLNGRLIHTIIIF